MADYRETSVQRVNELCDEVHASLDAIFDSLAVNSEGELAAREMDRISKDVDYLKTFALAGAKANVDGIDKLLNSEEEES